jgi:hypothetical protein
MPPWPRRRLSLGLGGVLGSWHARAADSETRRAPTLTRRDRDSSEAGPPPAGPPGPLTHSQIQSLAHARTHAARTAAASESAGEAVQVSGATADCQCRAAVTVRTLRFLSSAGAAAAAAARRLWWPGFRRLRPGRRPGPGSCRSLSHYAAATAESDQAPRPGRHHDGQPGHRGSLLLPVSSHVVLIPSLEELP